VGEAIPEKDSDTVTDVLVDEVCEDDAEAPIVVVTLPEKVLPDDDPGEPVECIEAVDVIDDEADKSVVAEDPGEPEPKEDPLVSADPLGAFEKEGESVGKGLALPAEVRDAETLDETEADCEAVKVSVGDPIFEGVPCVGEAHSVVTAVDEALLEIADEDDAQPEELEDDRPEYVKPADSDAPCENEARDELVDIGVGDNVSRELALDPKLSESRAECEEAAEEDAQRLGESESTAEALNILLDEAHRVGSSADAVVLALPLISDVPEARKLLLAVTEIAEDGVDCGEDDILLETLPPTVNDPVRELDDSTVFVPDNVDMTEDEDVTVVNAVIDEVEDSDLSIEELRTAVGVACTEGSGENEEIPVAVCAKAPSVRVTPTLREARGESDAVVVCCSDRD
jgi:hypothetical protein